MANTKGFEEALRRISKVQLYNENRLDLSELQLTSLPAELFELSSLIFLNLSANNLEQLPDEIGNLAALQDLHLYNNHLRTLPDSIGKLISLKLLPLFDNKLESLPNSIGELSSLQQLLVYNNHLSSLPGTIGNLTSLQQLFLHNNKLNSLSDAIGNLISLRQLIVYNNQLNSLPSSIGKLISLQIFDISKNQLSSLPDSIGNLASLQELSVSDNQLNSLPKSLKNFTELKELYLHGNPLLKIPPDILGPGKSKAFNEKVKPAAPQKILEYYFRTCIGKQPLNEAKLILVGRGEVGKTSIVDRLIKNRFNKRQIKTDGIKITSWEVELKKNDVVRLNVWDFGGQEIMHATHQFFLTERSLYLLVLDGRGGLEDNDAEYWLKIISSFGAYSPVIIVMNKIKSYPFDLNRRALQEKYPFIKIFVKTDCEDGTGIDQLLKEIKKETGILENLRVSFPTVWFDIKEKIARMKQNYISFAEFKKFCIDNGESEDSAHESLAYFLHQLGIALNFKDDPRLKETHVLNPHWLTQGIYKILNSSILVQKNGEITAEELPKIFDKNKYPKEMHCFLLELMRKFELCFKTPGKENSFLIPELLGKEEPKETKDFKPEECLNFQYNYSVLPNGLLPRFIVRTYTLSEGLKRWRTGVFLQLNGCSAMVKADIADKKVFISIKGDIEKRRNLLTLIRSDFERIHHDIKNLLPEKFIPIPGSPNITIPYNELIEFEKNNRTVYEKFIDGNIVPLNVRDLLNGVNVMRKNIEPAKLFISYCHVDEYYKNRFETHLKILQKENVISVWNDRRIIAGAEWKEEIDYNLENANIIVFLVSADFIASNYCYDKEMKRAMEKHENNEAVIIPIIIKSCRWQKAPFNKLQLLPKDGKDIKSWKDKDAAWTGVVEAIENAVKGLSLSSNKNTNVYKS